MGEPASKLEQLRIDRGTTPPRRASRFIAWVAAALACFAIGAGLWFRLDPSAPVIAAAATPAAPATAESAAAPPPATSVLDASGYVVARRQATVSSKVTGRLAEVLVEEGQRIVAGQVIARLDNTNATANLAQAEARVGEADANLQAARVALADTEPSSKRSGSSFAAGSRVPSKSRLPARISTAGRWQFWWRSSPSPWREPRSRWPNGISRTRSSARRSEGS